VTNIVTLTYEKKKASRLVNSLEERASSNASGLASSSDSFVRHRCILFAECTGVSFSRPYQASGRIRGNVPKGTGITSGNLKSSRCCSQRAIQLSSYKHLVSGLSGSPWFRLSFLIIREYPVDLLKAHPDGEQHGHQIPAYFDENDR